ncbi:TetR/AcrR family transcriptional regulator [Conexibacter sp. JD483]|uniref:TetR/AcrR family transcriptional regulator n=1 Tax=unclassified Conexibacter TaxID=2627773 RepID=UPI00271F5A00|nr:MULTISPECIES: TetR/AcrR family transcriptional regulator [unclassified Conexibacter]MDO8184971.1 TetR/AcrR family transcriptional regulator [Conexibacter sp. CPCC 205706]MDO8198115.1 TetR/AcrR family transcriptional regulator [Conexibacter sp. CPCC 205762]MDR9368263.1 TetR/AcrR family transcriptional regulator [Conexibacter sp. JD483]
MSADPGRVWGGMTSSERELRRREQFLAAGLELFAARGWTATTVTDVCREARLSQRYFYEQFDSREALFLAVVDRAAEQIEAVVQAAANAPGRSAQEQAHGVLSALAEHFAADPRTVRVTLVESFATPAFRARRAVLVERFSALAARLMVGLAPDPSAVDARSLQLSALIVSGGIAEALIASATGRAPADPDELVTHLTALYTAAAALATR